MNLVFSRSNGENTDHGELNECFGRFDLSFIIFGKPSIPGKPGEGSLHNPSFGQDLEFVCIGSFNNREFPFQLFECQCHPIQQMTCITTVGKEDLETRKIPSIFEQAFQYCLCSVAVLHVCGVHHHGQQKSQNIHHDMSFSPFDLFSGIIPGIFSTDGDCFRTLRI